MILQAFDKNFVRTGLIDKYKYASYLDIFSSVGNFQIEMPLIEANKLIALNSTYILLDDSILGVIERISKEQTANTYLEISGRLISSILTRRIFSDNNMATQTYAGQEATVMYSMVTRNFINPTDPKRKISFIKNTTDPTYIFPSEYIEKQITGSNVSDELTKIALVNDLGFELVPVINTLKDANDDVLTNITSLEFRVLKGKDRTLGNTAGNVPVLFSTAGNNLLTSNYSKTRDKYKSVAYVAGEGEGTARTIIQAGDINTTGLDRYETFVDARDLQSKNEAGTTIPTNTYLEILRQRGVEKLQTFRVFESYDATVATKQSYKYGVDYYKGDFVTIEDTEMNIRITAIINSVSKSIDSNGEHLDIVFGYESVTVLDALK